MTVGLTQSKRVRVALGGQTTEPRVPEGSDLNQAKPSQGSQKSSQPKPSQKTIQKKL